jgi:hypothetical protein
MQDRLRPILPAAALIAACLLLSACGDDVSRAFGFTRTTPNEFTVTTRAPLAMPADDRLVAPQPGAARPQEQGARNEALESIAPDVAIRGAYGPDTPGQDAIIAAAGGRAAAPHRGELRDSNGGLVSGLMFWHGKPAETLVDAQAESRRLTDAAANGQGPTDGATPTLRPH